MVGSEGEWIIMKEPEKNTYEVHYFILHLIIRSHGKSSGS